MYPHFIDGLINQEVKVVIIRKKIHKEDNYLLSYYSTYLLYNRETLREREILGLEEDLVFITI